MIFYRIKDEFIAANSTSDQIASKLGADMVIYQDLEDMEEAVRDQNKGITSFCKACFTGNYPTGDVSEEILSRIAGERDEVKKKQMHLSLH